MKNTAARGGSPGRPAEAQGPRPRGLLAGRRRRSAGTGQSRAAGTHAAPARHRAAAAAWPWSRMQSADGVGLRCVGAWGRGTGRRDQGAEMVLQRRTTKNEEAVSQPWWILAGEEKERLGK